MHQATPAISSTSDSSNLLIKSNISSSPSLEGAQTGGENGLPLISCLNGTKSSSGGNSNSVRACVLRCSFRCVGSYFPVGFL